jgi:hypothetical protein
MTPTNLSSLLRTAPKPDGVGVYRTAKASPANPHGTPSDGGSPDGTHLSSTAAPPLLTGSGNDPNDLASIREILLGPLPEELVRQIERIEVKISQGAADLSAALSAFEQRLEKRVGAVDATTRTANGELRQQLLEEMRVVNEAVETYHAKAMRRIEEGLQELRTAKLDQSTFSSFLQSLARYLSRDDAARQDAQEAR